MSEDALKILIVEDSPEDRDVYVRMLKQHEGRRYRVLDTEYGEEGLELARSEHPECLILDFNLPDMNGLEFLDSLVAGGDAPCGIIMMTGQGNEAVAVEAMKKGAADYLVKGKISTEALRLAVDNAMEKVRLRKELAQKTAELVRSNRELDQYARVVAHDLKTPLHGIVSYLDIFSERCGAKLAPEDKNLVDSAMRCAGRMDSLIKDVLTYSRLGGAQSKLSAVNCDQILAKALENLAHSIEEKSATVKVDALPQVHGNASQLLQLFQNLIGNGMKFCKGRAPEIRVSAMHKESEWLFSVSDNGIGMEKADLERVFVAFERLHPNSEFPGTGLGLAICKKIVELHGGVIWVESKPGEGSIFYFTLLAPQES